VNREQTNRLAIGAGVAVVLGIAAGAVTRFDAGPQKKPAPKAAAAAPAAGGPILQVQVTPPTQAPGYAPKPLPPAQKIPTLGPTLVAKAAAPVAARPAAPASQPVLALNAQRPAPTQVQPVARVQPAAVQQPRAVQLPPIPQGDARWAANRRGPPGWAQAADDEDGPRYAPPPRWRAAPPPDADDDDDAPPPPRRWRRGYDGPGYPPPPPPEPDL